MADSNGIWQRGGANIEELPKPFEQLPDEQRPIRRNRWHLPFYAVSALLFVLLVWLLFTAPLSRALEPLPRPALLLVSAEGRPIARRGAIKGRPVEIAELDPLTTAAFIAIEDRRFRRHWGIDPRSIGRAIAANARAGSVRQGGSTITQQLAKTSFLSADRSFKRKLQEMVIAVWLEAWLSKDEILSRYLSSIYFGDGVYGLRAAARHYFDRPPERLSLAQSAMLAGIVQAPSRLAPTRHLERAQKRARLVLEAMAQTGAISRARLAATSAARPSERTDALPTGTYFADWVAPAAEGAFERGFGEVRVATTLDADLQRLAVRAITNAGLGKAQAALVAMRPDGRVVAMVGGRSYKASPFNRATQARRQPGSAFKLFVYLAALRAGYRADSLIDDRPITVDGWTPVNSDGVYRGQISLRQAFAGSSNTASVRLAQSIGTERVIEAARDLGLGGPLEDRPSLALGTSGVRLIELTAAYAAIAGGHYPVRPIGLQPVEGLAGGRSPGRSARLDLRRERAPILDLLWAAANEGTGRGAALAVATFGKTGTSQGNRDALFVGFAGDLVVGVWVGRDDDRSLGAVTGGTVPATIWRAFMQSALAIDGRTSPSLPREYRAPARRLPGTERAPPRRSPEPEEWNAGLRLLLDIIERTDRLIEEY